MEIRDLGPLLVEQDGLPTALGSGRLASVLSPLANQVGALVTTATLIDAVWGEAAPERAGQLLESLIWRLRKLVEPGRAARAQSAVLRHEPLGYRLDPAAAAVDSAHLRAALPQVRAWSAGSEHDRVLARTATVLALWRGEPYADVLDTGWLGPARQELQDVRIDLAELRIDSLLEVGRPEEAVGELGPLLVDQPFRERLWGQRMLGLYRSGRQADALSTFAEARDVLAEELGIEPGSELRELQRRILDQDPALDGRGAKSIGVRSGTIRLPRRRAELIGRGGDVETVARLLVRHPLVTLVGPGGAGKTRLAVEVGYATQATFPDGVWFVDLAAIADAGLLTAALAGAIGLPDQAGARSIDVVAAFLAQRRALLVMDNCEHLVAASGDAIEEILDGCPYVRVLATSREPLDLPGELRHPVQPLSVDQPTVGPPPAVALFAARVRDSVDVDPDGPDADLVRRICVAVGGLPLGIELAAAQARTFELAEIVESLEQNPAALARRGSGPQRQASLRDAVDWGYRLARRDEQVLHRRLAVVPGPFTLEVAAALCVPPLHADQAMQLLGGLVHRSLLTSSRPAGAGRASTFGQLAPIRAHASGVLDADERAAVEIARDRFVVRRLGQAPLWGPPGPAALWAWCDDNAATLRATLESMLVSRPDRAGIGVVVSMIGIWYEQGRLAEAAHWTEQLRALPDRVDTDPLDRALIDAAVGSVLAFQHRAAEAREVLSRALPVLRTPAVERRVVVAGALLIGAAAAWTGDVWDVVDKYVTVGLEVGRAADLPQLVIAARAIQAVNWTFTDDADAGVAAAREVLRDNEGLGNDLAALFGLVTLTMTAMVAGDPVAALGTSDEILRTHRRMGALAVGDTIESRAAIRAATGDLGEAVRCLGASSALSRRIGRDWPWHESTPSVLASLRRQVDPTEFEQLWASGERLGRGDPEQFTPEWI